jgi:hypothetical protein
MGLAMDMSPQFTSVACFRYDPQEETFNHR